jgi:hypothetical protein
MKLNSSDDRAIARNQAQETLYNYPYPKIDPFLEADLLHGWMFKQIIKWDRVIYGRWDYWINCAYNNIKRKQSPDYHFKFDQDIPKIDFLEPNYNHPGTQMLKYCLINIPHPRLGDRGKNIIHFRYLVDWILFGLGDKNSTKLPTEPEGCDGASNRLFQIFSVPHFMVNPCDYLGHYLQETGYIPDGVLQKPKIIRKHQIGEILRPKDSNQQDYYENQIDDPEILTGRVLLELSNYVNILSGISNDELLGKCALINGYFFAPWVSKHLSEDLPAIYNSKTQEEISTQISELEILRLKNLCDRSTALSSYLTYRDFDYILITSGMKIHGRRLYS